jgi:ABC-type lipoprotein export system ATPase subunit
VGFVFQLHHLLPQLSLIENVLVPQVPLRDKGSRKAVTERVMDLLKKVGLHDKIHQRPGQLSVGECQRGAVVRALVNEPEFILADEPTGSLDQENADSLGDLLALLSKDDQVAVVVVTHAMDLARKMKTILRLEDGHLSVPEGESKK